jgi:hypothetical protein
MATTLYTTFSSVPPNRNARRAIFREARLGTRPKAAAIDYGEALRAVDAARAYKEGWQTSTQDFPQVVRTAWAGR